MCAFGVVEVCCIGSCFYWRVVLWSKSTWELWVLFVSGKVQTCKKRDSPWVKCLSVLGFAFMLLGSKNLLRFMLIYLCYLIICRRVIEWAVHNLSDKLMLYHSDSTCNTTDMQIAPGEHYLLSDCHINVPKSRCYLDLGSWFCFVCLKIFFLRDTLNLI